MNPVNSYVYLFQNNRRKGDGHQRGNRKSMKEGVF
jgi:hypothetical protein